jgi:PAS domain S-box-containing protein
MKFSLLTGLRSASRLLWTSVGVSALAGLLVALALQYLRDTAIQTGVMQADTLARILEEQTSRSLQAVDQRLELAAGAVLARQAVGGLNPAQGRVLLRQQLDKLPFLRAIWVLDAQGRISLDSDEGHIGVKLDDRPYFTIYSAQPDTAFYIGKPVRSRTMGTWLISASRPLRAADGRFLGVIVAAIEPPYFDQLWRTVNLGFGGAISLLHRDGTLMMRSPFDPALLGQVAPGLLLQNDALKRSAAGSFIKASAYDGEQRVFAYRTLSTQPDLVLVVGESLASVTAAWRRLAWLAGAVWALGSLVVCWQAWRLGRAEAQRRLDVEALKASEERYRHLFKDNPQCMWVYDLRTLAFLAANDAAVAQYGYSREEFLTMTLADLRPERDRAAILALFAQGGGGPSAIGTRTHRRKDGSEFRVEVTARNLRFSDRRGRLVLVTDVTERERAQAESQRLTEELDHHRDRLEEMVAQRTAELAVARAEAESANRAKSSFLANMSHEIRTPLSAILGLSRLLRQGGVTPEQAIRLGQIDRAGEHLLSIVNDVLDLSKIEAGHLVLESAHFNLPALLSNVVSILHEPAREKGLALQVQLDTASVPTWLQGDATRLQQALLNYAANAVKFTQHGSVVLQATLEREEGEQLLLRFAVTDTGPGIAPEVLADLFQPFRQGDVSTSRQHGGTGLGLAITHRLAQMMGGQAGADSQPGRGSTFWLTVRLARGAEVQPPRWARDSHTSAAVWLRQRHSGARILLAEDNPVNREVALAMLHEVGLQVDTAHNGLQVLERAQASQAAQPPCANYELVLMDMQMPLMDGLQATRALRALPGWQHTPIVALTANAFDDDRLACAEAGMNDFLSKPFVPERLYTLLLRWLEA